ncbi:MAG: hypothetical protein ACK6D7_01265 [Acidobacteriota bacterium]
MSPFLSAFSLEARLLFVLSLYWLVGITTFSLLTRRSRRFSSVAPLIIPLGFLVVLVVACITLRLILLLRAEPPAFLDEYGIILGITTATIIGLIIGACRSSRERRRLLSLLASPRFRTPHVTTFAVAFFSANLLLAPLLFDHELRYFSGVGTDAAGYVRTAAAMSDGYYFAPNPADPATTALKNPARHWVYHIKSIVDRPGAYLQVAFHASSLGLNHFQGYLLSGAVAIAVVACGLLSITSAFGLGSGIALLSALVALSYSGLIGNYYHQFYAQCLGSAVLVVAGLVCFRMFFESSDRLVDKIVASFLLTVAAGETYDVRYAIIATNSWLWTHILLRLGPGIRSTIPWRQFLELVGSAVVAVAVYLAILNQPAGTLLSGLPRVDEPYSALKGWMALAGLGEADFFWSGGLLIILILGTLLLISNLDRLMSTSEEKFQIWFPFSTYCAIVFASFLAGFLYLVLTESWWAAKRTVLSFLPFALFLIVTTLASIGEKLSRASSFLPLPRTVRLTALLAILLLAGRFGLGQLDRLWQAVLNKDQSALRTTGILAAWEDVKRNKPSAVYIATNEPQRFLTIISLLDYLAIPTSATYPVWTGGAGLSFPEPRKKEIYETVNQQVLGGSLGPNLFFIADIDAAGNKPSLRKGADIAYGVLPATGARPEVLTNRFDVVFSDGVGVRSEPLVLSGEPGKAFIILAETDASTNRLRIGIDIWGRPIKFGEWVDFQPKKPRQLVLAADASARNLEVRLDDDRYVLTVANLPDLFGRPLIIGQNEIGATTCARRFSGTITSHQ